MEPSKERSWRDGYEYDPERGRTSYRCQRRTRRARWLLAVELRLRIGVSSSLGFIAWPGRAALSGEWRVAERWRRRRCGSASLVRLGSPLLRLPTPPTAAQRAPSRQTFSTQTFFSFLSGSLENFSVHAESSPSRASQLTIFTSYAFENKTREI